MNGPSESFSNLCAYSYITIKIKNYMFAEISAITLYVLRLDKNLLIYGQNTQIVMYIVGGL